MATGDEILDRALALVEAEGAEALPMRRLAGELGVATTTIYWHVGNRDDLVTAVVRRHGEQMARTPVNGDTARDRVLDVARLIWRTSLEHREVTRLAAAHGASTLQARELELAMARELQTAGVVGTAARDAMRAITACVGGFLVAALRTDQTPGPSAEPPCWPTSAPMTGTWTRPLARHWPNQRTSQRCSSRRCKPSWSRLSPPTYRPTRTSEAVRAQNPARRRSDTPRPAA